MKVLFVAVFSPESTNVSQAEGFRKNGCEVVEFNYRKIASQVGDEQRDNMLINLCRDEKPNFVVFSKCNEIHHRVVDECNKIAKTVLWYMDTMNGNYNQSLIEKIKRCNYVFCGIWDSYENAKKLNPNTQFLHEGYDWVCNQYVELVPKYDVSFIGGLRNKRHDYYNAIGFKLIEDAYGIAHSVAVGYSKINLNFTEGGTSDRTYKVLASKGFLLTEPYPHLEDDFMIGRDLDVFTNVEELKAKIEYYLANEGIRQRIAQSGYETVQKFSRINWAKRIIEIGC